VREIERAIHAVRHEEELAALDDALNNLRNAGAPPYSRLAAVLQRFAAVLQRFAAILQRFAAVLQGRCTTQRRCAALQTFREVLKTFYSRFTDVLQKF
jgi:hypothetical protein